MTDEDMAKIKEKRRTFVFNVLSQIVDSSFLPATYDISGKTLRIAADGVVLRQGELVPEANQIVFRGEIVENEIVGLLTYKLWDLVDGQVRFLFVKYAF